MQDWHTELQAHGWITQDHPQAVDLSAVLEEIAHTLGTASFGRGGQVIERLRPVPEAHAHPQSLSHKYGLGAFPLHNDTAHYSTPCHFIVMGCEEPGDISSPTVLLDTHVLALDEDEIHALYSASFFIKNGRKSFYSSIKSKDRPFFRFDPGCMHPVLVDGNKAINALRAERHVENLIEIEWAKNRIAIIDNWRILHGRGNYNQADPRRSLLRITVK